MLVLTCCGVQGVPGKAVKGEYSWTAPNGEDFHVKYTADHRGFRVHETDAVATFKDAGLPADGRNFFHKKYRKFGKILSFLDLAEIEYHQQLG